MGIDSILNMSYVGNLSINKKRYEVFESKEEGLYRVYVRDFARNKVLLINVECSMLSDSDDVLDGIKKVIIYRVKMEGINSSIEIGCIADEIYPIKLWDEILSLCSQNG